MMTKNGIVHRAWILLASTALAGCYAEIEDSNVSFTETNVCGTPSACTGNGTTLTLGSVFIPAVNVKLGDAGMFTSSQSKQGPITFDGSLILNKVTVTVTTPQTGDFSGITSVDLRAALNNDNCSQISPNCKSVASYDSTRDGPATRTLVIKGVGANLLDFASGTNKTITIIPKATGNAPVPVSWNGDIDMNTAIKARGSFP
jgi:hypothetical protein